MKNCISEISIKNQEKFTFFKKFFLFIILKISIFQAKLCNVDPFEKSFFVHMYEHVSISRKRTLFVITFKYSLRPYVRKYKQFEETKFFRHNSLRSF